MIFHGEVTVPWLVGWLVGGQSLSEPAGRNPLLVASEVLCQRDNVPMGGVYVPKWEVVVEVMAVVLFQMCGLPDYVYYC